MENDSCGTNDEKIVRQVIAGDVNAFEHLLEKYQNLVLRIVKKHVPHDQVRDLVQEVFIRMYQSLLTFDDRSSFPQWVSTIAVRTCYDFWRKRGKWREVSLSFLNAEHQAWIEAALSGEASQSFRERGREREAGEILDWALDKLSAEDRMVLELVYLEGHTVKEAASLLGWSSAKVKVRSFRSRKKLYRLLTRRMEPGRR